MKKKESANLESEFAFQAERRKLSCFSRENLIEASLLSKKALMLQVQLGAGKNIDLSRFVSQINLMPSESVMKKTATSSLIDLVAAQTLLLRKLEQILKEANLVEYLDSQPKHKPIDLKKIAASVNLTEWEALNFVRKLKLRTIETLSVVLVFPK